MMLRFARPDSMIYKMFFEMICRMIRKMIHV